MTWVCVRLAFDLLLIFLPFLLKYKIIYVQQASFVELLKFNDLQGNSFQKTHGAEGSRHGAHACLAVLLLAYCLSGVSSSVELASCTIYNLSYNRIATAPPIEAGKQAD